MLLLRGALAIGMAVCGAIVCVRVAAFGLRLETMPGIVLGAAMVALGLHRLSLIARVRRSTSR
jgi:hypothetical protein